VWPELKEQVEVEEALVRELLELHHPLFETCQQEEPEREVRSLELARWESASRHSCDPGNQKRRCFAAEGPPCRCCGAVQRATGQMLGSSTTTARRYSNTKIAIIDRNLAEPRPPRSQFWRKHPRPAPSPSRARKFQLPPWQKGSLFEPLLRRGEFPGNQCLI